MADIVKQDVLEGSPELARVSDVAWSTALLFANSLTAQGVGGGESGPLVKLLRVLLAAHYVTVFKRGRSGAVGPVTSEAVGAVRRSFGLVALASSDGALGSTVYGQQFLGLIAMSNANGPHLA